MFLPWVLLLVSSTVAQGVNPCLDSDSIRCIPGATTIDMGYCGLGDEDFGDLSLCLDNAGRSTITEVYLDDNEFSNIPEGLFKGLTKVTLMRLNHLPNLIEVPEGLFNGLTSLVKISIRDNMLETLPEGLFEGLNLLIEIQMDHNPIKFLPAGLFQGLSGLQKLRLRDLNLYEVHEDLFSGLSALREL